MSIKYCIDIASPHCVFHYIFYLKFLSKNICHRDCTDKVSLQYVFSSDVLSDIYMQNICHNVCIMIEIFAPLKYVSCVHSYMHIKYIIN